MVLQLASFFEGLDSSLLEWNSNKRNVIVDGVDGVEITHYLEMMVTITKQYGSVLMDIYQMESHF